MPDNDSGRWLGQRSWRIFPQDLKQGDVNSDVVFRSLNLYCAVLFYITITFSGEAPCPQ